MECLTAFARCICGSDLRVASCKRRPSAAAQWQQFSPSSSSPCARVWCVRGRGWWWLLAAAAVSGGWSCRWWLGAWSVGVLVPVRSAPALAIALILTALFWSWRRSPHSTELWESPHPSVLLPPSVGVCVEFEAVYRLSAVPFGRYDVTNGDTGFARYVLSPAGGQGAQDNSGGSGRRLRPH